MLNLSYVAKRGVVWRINSINLWSKKLCLLKIYQLRMCNEIDKGVVCKTVSHYSTCSVSFNESVFEGVDIG